jgi:hypothetical protein
MPDRDVVREFLNRRYHGVIEITEEMIDAVIAEIPPVE